jgi:hypothetical protein
VLGVFVDEVIVQCEFALMSMDDLREGLELDRQDKKRVFYSAQAFLVAVANLSKLFWPGESRLRGEELRKLLEIKEDSPIKDRTLRHIYEHFDERIATWASCSSRKDYDDMNISIAGPLVPGVEPSDSMRNLEMSFDHKTFKLTFHDDSYDPIITEAEVRKVLEKARRFSLRLWKR